ncbi:MAG TPA: FxLYD domain-containing protein [Methylomirabilota bacterium]|nr:FxLYD domain-containing protein [Methylomirabilota bacterium]
MRIAMKRLLLVTMAVLALAAGSPARPAAALSATSSVDARIRLDWEVGTTRGGRPVIQGYVYNDYGRPASDVQLLVETLDASGAVIGRTVGFVRGVVQLNDRTYFEVPIKVTGASYRVSVTGFDWRGGGGGA